MISIPAVRWTAVALALAVGAAAATGPAPSVPRFSDATKQAEEFLGYWQTIRLTAAEEAVKREALAAIPAPCCSDNGLDTCCCPCNLAKTAWGLAAHLIRDRQYDAAQVRAKVGEWLEFVNPRGFSGDVCYQPGGCARPMSANGCGGMREPVLP